MATRPARTSSRKHANNDEESIYNVGNHVVSAAPKVQTYNAIAPVRQPKTKMHADSSQVESLLNPVRGPRDAQIRAGITPTDHAKHNRTAIKEASQMNALRKLSADNPPQSRKNSAIGTPGARLQVARRSSSGDGSRNFVAENKLQAGQTKPARTLSEEEDTKFVQKKEYGRVPQYLVDRKAEMAAAYEAQLAAKEAALIPPGMRILPDEERLETLAMLAKNKEEVDKAIRALPFVIETPSQIRRQNDLQARLKEVDDAIKVFSRPKVLVQL